MLGEVEAYYEQLRREMSTSTAIVFALAFDPTATLLASGTTTGQLTVHSMSTAAAQPATLSDINARLDAIVAHYDLSADGAINSLCSKGEHLFIATDAGIRVLDWGALDSDAAPPYAFSRAQVNSLAPVADADSLVVGVASNGSVILVDATVNKIAESIKLPEHFGRVAYAHSVAASPADRYCGLLGCDDGVVRQIDLRRSKGVIREIIPSFPLATQTMSPYISCIAFNCDGTYAMIASSERKLSSLHVSSSSIFASERLPFVPQAICASSSNFYVGGSDRRVGCGSIVPNSLLSFDVLGSPMPSAPVSAGAVYCVAAHPVKGILAAAGFTPAVSLLPTKRLIDVYVNPPVRSFSLSI